MSVSLRNGGLSDGNVDLLHALYDATIGVFSAQQYSMYNVPTWTMRYHLFGALYLSVLQVSCSGFSTLHRCVLMMNNVWQHGVLFLGHSCISQQVDGFVESTKVLCIPSSCIHLHGGLLVANLVPDFEQVLLHVFSSWHGHC